MSCPINDLPDEVLSDITRRLDQVSLKAAILTCQDWKEIIETHCSWSLKLRDESISCYAPNMLLETNRKFHIELIISNYFASHMIDDCKQIGSRVTVLIWEKQLDHLQFLELLKCLPNLERLHVRNVTIPEKLDNCEVPELKKLKRLTTWNCHENIFKCFRTLNLKYLAIRGYRKFSTSTLQNMANFILLQANLRKLIVHFCEDMLFEQLSQKTFKLTELVLLPARGLKYSTGLAKFVKIQSETLRKFISDETLAKPVYQLIFGELKKLEFLALRDIPTEPEFLMSLKTNLNIEKLIFHNHNFSLPALQLFCKCVPNVKNLSLLAYFNADQLEIISTTLRKITTLHVLELCENFNKIKFPNLTSFHTEDVSIHEIVWDTFTKANCTITEIIVKSVYIAEFTSKHIETITSNLKLQRLKIGKGFKTDVRFLSIIHKNCPDLKVLELHKSCGIQDFPWIDGCAVSLRLCN